MVRLLVDAFLEDGAEILLDDGRIRLAVVSHGENYANTIVQVGGKLSDHKGVNLPRVPLRLGALTEKDRQDLSFAIDMGADWIALSFVQRPDDVVAARALVAGRAAIMTKLAKPAALNSLVQIMELSD